MESNRMSCSVDQTLLPLEDIVQRCAHETDRFFHHQDSDPRYCFELLRRAIVDRCQRAWEFVYTQYQSLVTSWVRRHTAFPACHEEAQYLVNRAFEKMWTALTPAKFECFPDLRSLLRYLQMCVHSVILDVVRTTERFDIIPYEHVSTQKNPEPTAVEDQALEHMQRQTLWKEISARMQNDQERHVVYGSYVLAMKPREICAQFPDLFRDVKQVYRVKENVLARLRRDDELVRLLCQNT
jgi:DNA-directed RNA polymerase specialized sigma24 family protein